MNTRKKRADIRATPGGKWRGYINDVRVAEFENTVTETAQQVAERWLQQRNAGKKPQKRKPIVDAAPRPSSENAPAQAAPRPVKHVEINCEDVLRRGLDRHPSFVRLYWEMQESFGDRGYGFEVSLHEAAHAILMEQDGIANVRCAGPDIVYDTFARKFVASSSRAVGDDQPNAIVTDDFIFTITSHMAAGGVALRLFTKAKEHGDEDDFESFKRKYANQPVSTGESAEAFWKRVQDAVAVRLSEPETQAKVLARADEYLKKLYPPAV